MYRNFPGSPKTRRTLKYLLAFAVICFFATPGFAQLQLGDVNMNLSGNLGYGYSGAFGTIDSGHGQNLVGSGYLTGSYYNPNFLSFNVRPFFDRTQDNSVSQVTSHDSGLDASVDFFRGSHFPGSVGFTKQYTNTGEFGLPGGAGLVTDGSGQTFEVSWSELLPGLPPLYASYFTQSNAFTAIGTSEENHSKSNLFALSSNYRLKGFDLTAALTHSSQQFNFPDILGFSNLNGGGSSTSYNFTAQHNLPLHGTFNLGWGHSTYGNDYNAGPDGSSTTTGVGLGFVPWKRLQLNSNLTYTTNATAALGETLVSEGAIPVLNTAQNSRSVQVNSRATLWITKGLTVTGHASQTEVSFFGRDYSNTQYGGSLNYRYAQRLLGMLFFSLGVVDNANKQGHSNLGLVGNVGLNRKINGWETSADFGYSQDVQTILGLDATSSVTYGGSLRRKINEETYWGGSYRATHTALVRLEGESSGSEAFSTSISWKRYSGAVTYAQSRGTSVLTPNGVLNPTPIAPLVTNDFVFFNARSLGVGGSAVFLGRVRVGGNYAKVHSSTEATLANSISQAEIYNLRTEYKVRKLSFVGGFTRVDQGISTANNGLPTVVNSFYLSISRWFNVF